MLYAVEYFQKPYKDENHTTTRVINGVLYTINRPNHGVAHSIRQGFLVRDIVYLLNLTRKWSFPSGEYFRTKLAILASFQRSGRESEVSNSSNPQLYEKYEKQDVINMINSTDTKYFRNVEEIKLWASALVWNDNNKTKFVKTLSKLIKAAHLLDLRRIPSFNEARIRKEVSELLNIHTNSYIMNKLWDQSGKYLQISGDRDLAINNTHYSDKFYILQQQPINLFYKLREKTLC